jgi:hypothetical protein
VGGSGGTFTLTLPHDAETCTSASVTYAEWANLATSEVPELPEYPDEIDPDIRSRLAAAIVFLHGLRATASLQSAGGCYKVSYADLHARGLQATNKLRGLFEKVDALTQDMVRKTLEPFQAKKWKQLRDDIEDESDVYNLIQDALFQIKTAASSLASADNLVFVLSPRPSSLAKTLTPSSSARTNYDRSKTPSDSKTPPAASSPASATRPETPAASSPASATRPKTHAASLSPPASAKTLAASSSPPAMTHDDLSTAPQREFTISIGPDHIRPDTATSGRKRLTASFQAKSKMIINQIDNFMMKDGTFTAAEERNDPATERIVARKIFYMIRFFLSKYCFPKNPGTAHHPAQVTDGATGKVLEYNISELDIAKYDKTQLENMSKLCASIERLFKGVQLSYEEDYREVFKKVKPDDWDVPGIKNERDAYDMVLKWIMQLRNNAEKLKDADVVVFAPTHQRHNIVPASMDSFLHKPNVLVLSPIQSTAFAPKQQPTVFLDKKATRQKQLDAIASSLMANKQVTQVVQLVDIDAYDPDMIAGVVQSIEDATGRSVKVYRLSTDDWRSVANPPRILSMGLRPHTALRV